MSLALGSCLDLGCWQTEGKRQQGHDCSMETGQLALLLDSVCSRENAKHREEAAG